MAKKQTRRSISVSRGTYERLKAYCETNQISMSQFVERRVGDYLGRSGADPQAAASVPSASAPSAAAPARAAAPAKEPVRPDAFSIAAQVQGESAKAPITTPGPASRLSSINQPISQAVAAPTPAQKPQSDEPMLKDPDAKLTADQIFTF